MFDLWTKLRVFSEKEAQFENLFVVDLPKIIKLIQISVACEEGGSPLSSSKRVL